jgi:RHS repeat-associated protein
VQVVAGNYVTTRVAQVAGKTSYSDMLNRPPAEVATSTVYLDALGRPIQKVAWAGSVTQQDIVQPIVYDALGRTPASYLPYPQDVNSGSYKLNATTQQAAFYQPTTALSRTARDTKPLVTTLYEASPLNRVLEQGAAGSAWQPGTSHTTKFLERVNTATDGVRRWDYDLSNNTASTTTTYAPAELLVKETRDEQDQLVTEFTDKQGKIILKRVSLAQPVCRVQGYYASGPFVITAPTNMKIIGVLAAKFGSGTGSDGVCENYTFGSCFADVTTQVRTKVADQLAASEVRSLTIPIDVNYLGDPCYGYSKALQVVVSCVPIEATPATMQTYYIYDDLNNLRTVISPEGVNTLIAANSWTLSADFLRSWCFRYDYDARKRPISKQVPGADAALLVYDQRDQLVLTQDGNQRQAGQGEWSFTKYDELGRPIMTGVVNLSGDRATQQAAVDRQAVFAEQVDNSTTIGYTLNRAFPTTITEANLLSRTFYDSYAMRYYDVSSQTYKPLNEGQLACTLATENWLVTPRGLATGTSMRIMGSTGSIGSWLTTATYYDQNYRPVQVVAQNQLNGTTNQFTTYDFVGKVLTTKSIVAPGSGQGYKDEKRFTYYTNGLPKEVFQNTYPNYTATTGQGEILLVKKTYNELSELLDKRLHSTDGTGSKFLQKVDYLYNIRGWLTHINNRNLNSTTEQRPGVYVFDNSDAAVADPDLFGLELIYNTAQFAGAVSQYNGNIAQAMWQTRTANSRNNKLRAFNYNYDPASRLKAAQYQTYDADANGSWGWNNKVQPVDFSVSGIEYDGNGNLLKMKRMGTINGSNDAPVSGVLDDLKYSYKAIVNNQLVQGNQVLGVDDGATQQSANHDFQDRGYKFGQSGVPEFSYDRNGNLISDQHKALSSSIYNRLNQPTLLNLGTNRIEYTYLANGTKLQKRTYSGNALVKTTDYVGPVVYETPAGSSSVPVFAQTPEGRVLYLPSTSGAAIPWKYEYHLKDHLGNLRFAFRADRENGAETQRRASMEAGNAGQEEAQFKHISETRLADPNHARTGSYVARLNARQGRRDGPSIRIKVAAGDSIRAEVYGRYDRTATSGSLLQSGALVLSGTSIGAAGIVGIDKQQPKIVQRRWLPLIGASLGIIPQLLKKRAALPNAYLRYEVFNRDSQLVSTKVQTIKRTELDEWQQLQIGTRVDSAGFVQVSLINESGDAAYFDDLSVNSVAPTPFQENHYDPFGLNLIGIEQNGLPNSVFQYNGKEKQDEFNLNWLDYGARLYDAQLGRLHVIDPHSENYLDLSAYSYTGNNPVSRIDPDGKDWFYYQAKGEKEKGWHYQQGDVATYTNEKGKTVTDKNGYNHLVVATQTGNNSDGAVIASITVYDQDKIVLQQGNAMSGGSDKFGNKYSATQRGNYMMNLNARDAKGPQRMNAALDNPEAFFGIQKINNDLAVTYTDGSVDRFGVTGAYGFGRIRLLETNQLSDGSIGINPKQVHGYYLHGKTDGHTFTHGCLCDKSENVFNYFWSGQGKDIREKVPFAIGIPVVKP